MQASWREIWSLRPLVLALRSQGSDFGSWERSLSSYVYEPELLTSDTLGIGWGVYLLRPILSRDSCRVLHTLPTSVLPTDSEMP